MSGADDFLKEFGESNPVDDFLAEFNQEEFDPSEGMSSAEAGLVSFGGGMVNAARGIRGLFGVLTGNDEILKEVKKESSEQRRLKKPLQDRFPVSSFVGEVAGETAATLPIGLGAAGATAKLATKLGPTATRFAAVGAGGAAEGGVIGAADGNAGEGALIGGGAGIALELALPRLSKLVKKSLNRGLSEGDVATVEAIEKLRGDLINSGHSADEVAAALDDISSLGVIPEGVTAPQIARKAAFEAEGIPMAGRSRITQQSDDFAREIQLSRQRDSKAADEMRQRIFEEDLALEERARAVAREMGADEDAAATIQTALGNLRSDFGTKKRAAYRELGNLIDNNPDASDLIPMPEDKISAAVQRAQGMLAPNDPAQDALDALLAEYKMLGDDIQMGPRYSTARFLDEDGNVLDSVRFRGTPKNLNLGNFEDFRIKVNSILDPADPKQSAALYTITNAYDRMADELVENLPTVGIPEDIIKLAKTARGITREEKIAFTPQRIVQKISKSASDGNPLMDASKVYDNIRRASNEDFNKLLSALKRGVEGGQEAIQNLKAAALVDFVEQATKTSRKLTSQSGASRHAFSGPAFTKAIDKFGRGKASRLFGDDWQTVKRLELIAESISVPDSAVQKGSAPDLINQLINSFARLSDKVPVVGSKFSDIASEEAARRELKQATNLVPNVDQIHDYIAFSAKRTAGILGLSSPATQTATEPDD